MGSHHEESHNHPSPDPIRLLCVQYVYAAIGDDVMGYFSNGSEGESYESALCSKCAHFDGCTVWFLHLMHNYDECNNPDSMLHVLIPRTKDNLHNEQCTMFIPAEKQEQSI